MLKKLRSIFIIDEESANAPASDSSGGLAHAEPAAEPVRTTPQQHTTVRVQGGEVSEKFLDVLLQALDKNDLDGFDYLEFKRFLRSLDKVDLDEATKFRTAFATGQTMGASKEKLLNSARRYVEVLGHENARFEQAVHNQRSKVVDEKQSVISSLEKSIEDNQREIARLTQEMEKAKTEIDVRRKEVAEAEARINETQADFTKTYQYLVGELNADMEKIGNFIA